MLQENLRDEWISESAWPDEWTGEKVRQGEGEKEKNDYVLR